MALTYVKQVERVITGVNSFAERLASARKEKGMSQAELARRAKVSAGAIGNLEAGTRAMPRSLLDIAKALEVRPEWLQTGLGPRSIHERGVRSEEPPAPAYSAVAPGDLALLQDIHSLPQERVEEIRAEAARWRRLTDELIAKRQVFGGLSESKEPRNGPPENEDGRGLRQSTPQKLRDPAAPKRRSKKNER